ncbi:MAG TPA: PRC-barrel domain-containing protein [Pyrinomonadaceae bacterium]|jgi:uncharacterized protein YrrD
MASSGNIHSIDALIGRAVLSRATANKLGQVHDLVIAPADGNVVGLSVRLSDESLRLIAYREVYSVGPDAVMIKSDESAIAVQDSPLKTLPLAKNNLTGVNVVTESGKLLGQIANIYFHLAETLLLIYEVRSSILDKLLGHALYFPTTEGRAISADLARVVVADDATERSNNSLEALAARLFGSPKADDPVVIVRSRGY